MDEKSKSNQLKKCASLNSLVNGNNQASSSSVQDSPVQREQNLSLSLLTPRTRRFSCSSNGNGATNSGLISPGPRLAPRISQLRQEECAENQQSREANHEREVHSALTISQSYEDLTLVMNENWSFKNSDEFSNPLHVTLPSASNSKCSSPSPTSSRHSVMKLQYGMSPSPTRRSFATRRSMSPIAIRPSPLGTLVGSVKRKFDMIEDTNSCSSSTSSQQQPYKKFFTENHSRGSSPIMSPLPICPSPDSSTTNSEFSGRITPKMFITTKAFSSMTSSPLSTHSFENDSPSPSSSSVNLPSSSSSSMSSKDQQERMEVASCTSVDSGVDANSDVGSSSEPMSSSTDGQSRDTGGGMLKNESKADDQEMIIEEDAVTPSKQFLFVN